MALLAANTPATGGANDYRYQYGYGTLTAYDDTDFEGDSCSRISVGGGPSLGIMAKGVNATAHGSSSYGYKMWAGCPFKMTSINWAATAGIPFLSISAIGVDTGATKFRAADTDTFIYAYFSSDGTANTASIGVGAKTAASTYNNSTSPYAITMGVLYLIEIEAQQTDSTHMLVTLYVDGVSRDSISVATGVFDTVAHTSVHAGHLSNINPTKGASYDGRWGHVYLTDNTGSIISARPTSLGDGTGLHGEVRLPTGDSTTQWKKADETTTGSYTEWDDALGAFNAATDFNTAVTDGQIQGSTFAGTAIAGTATIVGAGLHGAGNYLGGALQVELHDASAGSYVTAQQYPSDVAMYFMEFYGSPPSGSWSTTEVDACYGLCKRNYAGAHSRVDAFWKTHWYYSAAAAGTRRVFLC